MSNENESGTNRIREALNRIYDEPPPYFAEYLRRYKEDPKSRVFAPLAEAYRRQGKVDQAIEICRQGLNFHPNFAGGRVTLAKCYIDKQALGEAKTELIYVVERVPENILAQKLLGEVYLVEGDESSALHSFKLALLQAPEDEGLILKVAELEQKVQQSAVKSAEREKAPESDWQEQSSAEEAATLMATESAQSTPAAEETPNLVPSVREDGRIEMVPFDPEEQSDHVDRILGMEDSEEPDPFEVQHVSELFQKEQQSTEITTETLGDLYFSQGQYQKSLHIFEKIVAAHPQAVPASVQKKIQACRLKLGVEKETLVRERKIQLLKGILGRVQQGSSGG